MNRFADTLWSRQVQIGMLALLEIALVILGVSALVDQSWWQLAVILLIGLVVAPRLVAKKRDSASPPPAATPPPSAEDVRRAIEEHSTTTDAIRALRTAHPGLTLGAATEYVRSEVGNAE